jgi:hypothetical protein
VSSDYGTVLYLKLQFLPQSRANIKAHPLRFLGKEAVFIVRITRPYGTTADLINSIAEHIGLPVIGYRSLKLIVVHLTLYVPCIGGHAVALQAGRSRVRFPMVSLEFFIDIILPAALWPLGSTQPLTEMSTRNISWGVKTVGA